MSDGAEPDGPPQLAGDHPHLGQPGEVVAVEAGHLLLARPAPCAAAAIDGGRVPQVAGPLDAGDDERLAAVRLLAAVQQPQRLDDPARGRVVGEGDRLAVEPRGRVGRRVLAVGDRDLAEGLAASAPYACR